MYLEISSRQSGKSYRLMTAVRQFLSKDRKNVAIIITPRVEIGKFLKNLGFKYLDMFKYQDRMKFFSGEQIRSELFHREMIDFSSKNKRVFVDEFDFIGDELHGLPFLSIVDGYFVTTSKRTRSLEEIIDKNSQDFMCNLLYINQYKYEKHKSMIIDKSISRLYDSLGEEIFCLEIMNQFIV